nr:hypothetical protein [Tanacetum cinerariifolium]
MGVGLSKEEVDSAARKQSEGIFSMVLKRQIERFAGLGGK